MDFWKSTIDLFVFQIKSLKRVIKVKSRLVTHQRDRVHEVASVSEPKIRAQRTGIQSFYVTDPVILGLEIIPMILWREMQLVSANIVSNYFFLRSLVLIYQKGGDFFKADELIIASLQLLRIPGFITSPEDVDSKKTSYTVYLGHYKCTGLSSIFRMKHMELIRIFSPECANGRLRWYDWW